MRKGSALLGEGPIPNRAELGPRVRQHGRSKFTKKADHGASNARQAEEGIGARFPDVVAHVRGGQFAEGTQGARHPRRVPLEVKDSQEKGQANHSRG